ncbi:MAG TPA: hypothetical protein VFS21_15065 [Roseiflexaceae bacterium]|nr:hypothetical protein [Roseiflexaceae bacterium]
MTDERDMCLALLNSLLMTPHRDLASVAPVHREIINQDPRFYVRLAAWYADKGDVRDHQEMFVVALGLSQFPGHRDVGLALLRRLPPYQVARVVDFIKGHTVTRRVTKDGASPPRKRRKGQPPVELVTKTEQVGLFANVPRSMRTEIERYLRAREQDAERFDRAAVQGRQALKRLYAGLRIKPGQRAQAALFDEAPPQDSLLFAVKQIARAETPAEQAHAIVEHRIPYRVAAGLIRTMSPTVLVALIEVMSAQELINNIGSLKTRGAFDSPEVKALIEQRLEQAQGARRVSAYKAKVAVEASGVSGSVAEKLDQITDTQVKARGRIVRPTALLIDKSGSMSQAIEVGRQLGAMISSIGESDLFAYAFDTAAYPIEVHSDRLVDWEAALRGISAGGSTSCGVALEWMRRKGQRVEQIVMVTDEGENSAPLFKDAYQAYAQELDVRPEVVFVKIGGATTQLEQVCAQLGIAPRAFDFKGDYYALPNLIPLLSRPSMVDLLMEIMEYPLPAR